MDQERIVYLIEKYFNSTATDAEVQELHQWYRQADLSGEPVEAWQPGEKERLKEKLLQGLQQQISRPSTVSPSTHRRRRRYSIAAAAVILLMLGSGLCLYTSRQHRPSPSVVKTSPAPDIAPGHNGALLHLSNGQVISLDSIQDGVIATNGSQQIIKKNGTLTYAGSAGEVVYNDMTTPRGRQWQLTLPDGTQVWLNAASSIHYPLRFTGKERLVTITGEAYFEVVHNAAQPFRVQAGDMIVEDIGTAFNINAYADEPVIRATLVEGSAKVSKGGADKLLRPGQQAVIQPHSRRIAVSNADMEAAVGWKNGQTVFENEDIQAIMRQVSRWYDVDVVYEGPVPERLFTGGISRQSTLLQLLDILAFENVHYTLEGRRITIKP